MQIQVTMTPEQLLVLKQFLFYTRLGQSTVFGKAATDLALALEKDFGEDVLEMFDNHYGIPEITVDFSDDEGMSFNVL